MTRNQGFIAPIVDETSDLVVDTNRLEHADTSLVTRTAARIAAQRPIDDRARIEPQQCARRLVSLHRLVTMLTQTPDQPLRDHCAQGGRSEERCVGKACVMTCRSRCSPYHLITKTKNTQRYTIYK